MLNIIIIGMLLALGKYIVYLIFAVLLFIVVMVGYGIAWIYQFIKQKLFSKIKIEIVD